jgi:hypothetical protein
VDPDAGAARAFVDALLDEARRRPVVLLHDFSAYDGLGTVGRELERRAWLQLAYAGLGEDYHDMPWAVPVEADADLIERTAPGCRRVGFEARPFEGAPAPGFELGRTTFRCGADERIREYVAYRGHVTALTQMSVLAVTPR